jgi:hypothetical protein
MAAAAALVCLVTASGCAIGSDPSPEVVVLPPGPPARRGPPPHAPAHGYRRKHPHDPVELVYDAEVRVYVVLGREAVYWDGRRYLRCSDGGWRVSAYIDGVWAAVSSDEVPALLVARHAAKPGKPDKRGHGPPAKHGR